MSENYKRLDAVQQKIEDLVKKETRLRKKEQKGELTEEDEIELEGLEKELIDLKEVRRFWQGQVDKENQAAPIKKPSIPFSKATLNHCVRGDGLNLNIDYVSVKAPTLHIPSSVPAPAASSFLCETLARIEKVWVLDNEKACRIVIDAILTEVLLTEANDNLLGFCEVKNDWEGTGFGYTGDVDYMFGSSKTKSVDTIDSFLLVVEAKKEWPDSAVPQLLCEAGCLLKKRLAAGKNTPVFAVLTNGLLFRFFAVDTDGIVYASEPELLKIGQDGTYNSSTSLSEILRWFTWFMTSIKSIPPRASSEDLTAEKIEDSLGQIRSCFGPKNPISSKKLKTRQ